MGDRVVLMREGRIEQVGTPELVYSRPSSPYAADFLGVRNRLDVFVDGGQLVTVGGQSIGGARIAIQHADKTALQLFVRNHNVRLTTSESLKDGDLTVNGVLQQTTLSEGGRRKYVVDVDHTTWFAFNEGPVAADIGSRVALQVLAADVLVYRDDQLWAVRCRRSTRGRYGRSHDCPECLRDSRTKNRTSLEYR